MTGSLTRASQVFTFILNERCYSRHSGDRVEYATDGNGSPYAFGVLEAGYRKDMNIQEGIKLARDAIKAATQRDIASGYGLDIFTLTKEGIKHEVAERIESKFVKQEAMQ